LCLINSLQRLLETNLSIMQQFGASMFQRILMHLPFVIDSSPFFCSILDNAIAYTENEL